MNLLSLILIFMALIVAGCVFYVAWQFSSGEFEAKYANPGKKKSPGETNASYAITSEKKEPGESKES